MKNQLFTNVTRDPFTGAILDAIAAMEVTQEDVINHPSHYTQGSIECFDAMISAFGKEAFLDYCIINAFKYLWRYKHKNGVEDIEKARVYINKFLEVNGELNGNGND